MSSLAKEQQRAWEEEYKKKQLQRVPSVPEKYKTLWEHAERSWDILPEKYRFFRLPSLKKKESSFHNTFFPKDVLAHICFGEKIDKNHSVLETLPKGVVILNFEEAEKEFAPSIEATVEKLFGVEKDPIFLSSLLTAERGIFIYISPKTTLEKPLFITQKKEKGETLQPAKVFIYAGKESNASFIIDPGVKNASPFTVVTDLREGAKVKICSYTHPETKGIERFYFCRSFQKKESFFSFYTFGKNSSFVRYDVESYLEEEGAQSEIKGLFLLSESEQIHNRIKMNHLSPNCRSMQHFKHVLDGSSRASFDGHIFVEKGADLTEAYQLNNNLLLSPSAQARTSPNLQIYADDVKASHGATVGQLDEEMLFYLASRGIDPQTTGASLLLEGFCKEIIDALQIPEIEKEVSSWL